ncbi:MAG: thioredoxin family protein [Candidatus Kariarchaeaceae archaeon]|jgi:hypothetical protein
MNVLPNKRKLKKGRHIQIYSDDCTDCLEHIDNVEIGKCAGCTLEVIKFHNDSKFMKNNIDYEINVHPTTIIDEEIKIEGVPNFFWLCGDAFYSKLHKEYSLEK